MYQVENASWSVLTIGCYVLDASGTYWRLVEENPSEAHIFRAVSQDGRTAILRDPHRPVNAWLTDHAALVHDLVRTFEGTTITRRLP